MNSNNEASETNKIIRINSPCHVLFKCYSLGNIEGKNVVHKIKYQRINVDQKPKIITNSSLSYRQSDNDDKSNKIPDVLNNNGRCSSVAKTQNKSRYSIDLNHLKSLFDDGSSELSSHRFLYKFSDFDMVKIAEGFFSLDKNFKHVVSRQQKRRTTMCMSSNA